MQHRTVSILHFLRLIMKDFFINKPQIDNWMSPKFIVNQNTAKTSIVHTFNNWHASHTRNFKDPLASTYSSFNIIPEQATNHNTELVPIKFWSRKANNKKVTFHNTHCPLKSWNTTTRNFWTICIKNNTKALTKVTKDHQKKPKSLITTIIFNRLTVTINDVHSFNNRVHSW